VASQAEPGISLVVPAWNEARRLRRTLERYLPILIDQGLPYEVIVVVDGASDGTSRVVAEFAEQGALLLAFPDKLGKGGAILKGFRKARYATVGFIDADGPMNDQDFSRILTLAQESDCVVGTRGLFHHADNLSRNLAGVVWSLLVRLTFPSSVQDTQCGVKFFQRRVLDAVLPSVALTNWAFDVSLLHHIQRAGFSIQEMPFRWINGEGSQLHIAKAAPLMLASLVGLRLCNPPFNALIPRRTIDWLTRWMVSESVSIPNSESPALADHSIPIGGSHGVQRSRAPTSGVSAAPSPRLAPASGGLLVTPSASVGRAGAMNGPDVTTRT
jgi:glycosyltransferase involved in cell wall biosynthesis